MPNTIRQQIIEEIKSRLAVITKDNGYQTDAGMVLYYGRLQAPVPQELPAINIWDVDETMAREFGIRSRRFTLNIEAYISSQDLALPELGNILRADLEKALLRKALDQDKIDETFNNLVQYFDFIRSEVFLLEGPERIGGVVMEFAVVYQQALGDPYAIEGLS